MQHLRKGEHLASEMIVAANNLPSVVAARSGFDHKYPTAYDDLASKKRHESAAREGFSTAKRLRKRTEAKFGTQGSVPQPQQPAAAGPTTMTAGGSNPQAQPRVMKRPEPLSSSSATQSSLAVSGALPVTSEDVVVEVEEDYPMGWPSEAFVNVVLTVDHITVLPLLSGDQSAESQLTRVYAAGTKRARSEGDVGDKSSAPGVSGRDNIPLHMRALHLSRHMKVQLWNHARLQENFAVIVE
ncbi:hypothetical protein AnigIFM62618_008197 [Aspergillus niger]|nr:hypothetical protein AnigIFM62618_008197 [Aspergillus niger]